MKNTLLFILGFSLLSILCSGCNDKRIKTSIDLLEKDIVLIDSLDVRMHGKIASFDTVSLIKDLRMIVIIDGYCGICFTQLEKWKSTLIQTNMVDTSKVDILFYVHAYNYIPFDSYIESIDFEYPIVYDTTNLISRINNIPENSVFDCFLLKFDTIVVVGNPILFPELQKVYKKYIDGYNH